MIFSRDAMVHGTDHNVEDFLRGTLALEASALNTPLAAQVTQANDTLGLPSHVPPSQKIARHTPTYIDGLQTGILYSPIFAPWHLIQGLAQGADSPASYAVF